MAASSLRRCASRCLSTMAAFKSVHRFPSPNSPSILTRPMRPRRLKVVEPIHSSGLESQLANHREHNTAPEQARAVPPPGAIYPKSSRSQPACRRLRPEPEWRSARFAGHFLSLENRVGYILPLPRPADNAFPYNHNLCHGAFRTVRIPIAPAALQCQPGHPPCRYAPRMR